MVARAHSPRGEVVLRRSGDVLELRVNGVFVMDSARIDTERELARAALGAMTDPGHVVVGGLGLGATLAELLSDGRVRRVTVAELEPAVVGWMDDATLPGGDLLADPRVTVRTADVREVVAGLARDHGTGAAGGHADAILLDVDNGPDFLVHQGNSAVYEPPFLGTCAAALRTGGVLVVWSSTRSGALESALLEVFGNCVSQPLPVRLQDRPETYWLVAAERPGPGLSSWR